MPCPLLHVQTPASPVDGYRPALVLRLYSSGADHSCAGAGGRGGRGVTGAGREGGELPHRGSARLVPWVVSFLFAIFILVALAGSLFLFGLGCRFPSRTTFFVRSADP